MTLNWILPTAFLLGTLLLLAAATLSVVGFARHRRERLLARYETGGDASPDGPATLITPADSIDVSLRRPAPHVEWLQWIRQRDLRHLYSWLMLLDRGEATLFVICWATLAIPSALLLGLPSPIAIAGALIVTSIAWITVYRFRRQKRINAIADSVPEALDILVRSLRVGAPFTRALLLVGESMSGPIAEECATTAREISFGHDLVIALHDLAERCKNQDLHFLATAVAIQQSSGGNLAEILERLAVICRGRQQLKRKVNALTSEARWSGKVLSAFPIVAAGGIFLLSPGYFDDIAQSEYFIPLLVTVGVLLFANIIFMRSMLKIED